MLDHSYRIFTLSLGHSQDEEYLPLDRIRQGSLAATDLPDGQISDSLSSPSAKNISLFALVETAIERVPSRPHQRGVSRSSRTLGAGCGGRFRCERRTHFRKRT